MLARMLIPALAMIFAGSVYADGIRERPRRLLKGPRIAVHEVWREKWILVPECYESFSAVLLRCAPRSTLTSIHAISLANAQRGLLLRHRPPYPQAFTYSR